ncbi:MAG: EAL domain-containing response regulator [Acidobacteria bacterium]|nr:EAL domain-containing response regulator [Acidobacteriota bacterium]
MNGRPRGGDCVLIVDDDRYVTEALAMTLERNGRTTIVCSDLESAELTLARFPVTHLVTDVQFSGAFGFEGLHFVGQVKKLHPQCSIILITGFATDALRATALAHGATALLPKPFETSELEAVFGTGPEPADGAEYQMIRVPPIDELLRNDLLFAAFQPIVRLAAGGVTTFAYEALSRVRGRWPLGGPAELFAYAGRRSRLCELNVAAIECALRNAAGLPPSGALFMNVDPQALNARLVQAMKTAATRASIPLSRLVVEITERSNFAADESIDDVLVSLRAEGVRFALDDHGSAYSHLGMIDRIRPSFIKVSHEFGTGFEHDETKLRIIRHVVGLARDFGCQTVLEGVETPETADAARELGIGLAQGFYFGRPDVASHWIRTEGTRVIAAA